MALETATYISDLVSTNPTASDNISQGDDHIRLLKATLKSTFPNVTNAVTPTHTELNYVSGVTSAIQTQLGTKANTASPTLTGTIVLGAGDGTGTLTSATVRGAAGSGTNIAGTNLTLLAGNGTGTSGSGYIAFQTAAAGSSGSTANSLTERMRIDSAGNVGIGTTSPSSALDVNGAIEALGTLGASTPAYAFSNYQDAGMFRPTAAGSAVAFSTSATERMRIDSSGNVGIGTASPGQKLDVNGIIASSANIRVTNTANPYLSLNDGTATSYVQVASAALNLTVGGANPITFTTNALERFRIGSSGQLGIGGANYGTAGQVLKSNGSAAAPSWGDETGSMTLLGTLTANGANTRTLSSLTLTNYKQLWLVFDGLLSNNATSYDILFGNSTADDVAIVGGAIASGTAARGMFSVDLVSGITFGYSDKFASGNKTGQVTASLSPVTNSSTGISFAISSGSVTFAGGTIRVYGVS